MTTTSAAGQSTAYKQQLRDQLVQLQPLGPGPCGSTSPSWHAIVFTATRSLIDHPDDAADGDPGGVGNSRLKSSTGLALTVLVLIEGITILDVRAAPTVSVLLESLLGRPCGRQSPPLRLVPRIASMKPPIGGVYECTHARR